MSFFSKKKEDLEKTRSTLTISQGEIPDEIEGDHLIFACETDVGRQRKNNEDNYLMLNFNSCAVLESRHQMISSTDGRGILLMVSDGMGGAAAGDVASKMVRDTLQKWFKSRWCKGEIDKEEFPTILQGSIREANREVYKAAQKNSKYRGMGATITAVAIINNEVYIAQVGDSRCYLLRRDELIQITRDQSLVNKLIEAGNITREEARNHDARNVILQAIGVSERVEIGFYTLTLRSDDQLLICSDGLTDMLTDDKILDLIKDKKDVSTTVNKLVQEANNAGGKDNITIILANFKKNQKLDSSEITNTDTEKIEKTSRYTVPPDEDN